MILTTLSTSLIMSRIRRSLLYSLNRDVAIRHFELQKLFDGSTKINRSPSQSSYQLQTGHHTNYHPVTIPVTIRSPYQLPSGHHASYHPVTIPVTIRSPYQLPSGHHTRYHPVTIPVTIRSPYQLPSGHHNS